MSAQPSGKVTFLFTDIEGSTKLWERLPAEMAAAVANHDALMRNAIESNGGHVFKTVGDAFCAAFQTPSDAMNAAIVAQHSLAAESWGAVGAIRVRMALHSGVAEERADDYFGPSVNRVARLLSAGYGDQVLVSRVTAEQIRPRLSPDATLIDLGEHRLKDLLQAEHIFQLSVPGLVSDFPPIKTLDRQRHNLPAQPTSLVGRETEIAAARELLEHGGTRLLTLTGPGGVGKTRLGLQIAAESVEAFADGVWFVPLAPLVDPDLVASQIGIVVGVREAGDGRFLEQLKEEIADKQMLLVLDNFEHVAGAAAAIGSLLAACSKLKIVMTSRTVTRIYGERELLVSPLGLPDLRRLPSISALEDFGSIRLFVDRAQSVKQDFGLTEANARAVAEICVRLDGLPLAIELAAARIKLLPPADLLSRLESRLKLLTGGGADRDPRQQTLRGAIAWSYDLLNPAEQTLFRRLAVFAGGCTFEATELVVAGDGNLAIDVLDGISSLVDKSLLRQDETDQGEPRFYMLETLREFGLEQLEASGEAASQRERHARFYAQLANEVQPALDGAEPESALSLLETEHDNLRAAMSWGIQTDPELALALAGALWLFWDMGGHITEGREWLDKTLHLTIAHALPDTTRIPILRGAISLALVQSDYEMASDLADEKIAICRSIGDDLGAAFALNNLGWAVASRGDYERAESLYSESLTLYRALGHLPGESGALMNLGALAFLQGKFDEAAGLYEDNLARVRAAGIKPNLPIALANLGDALRHAGEHDRALGHYGEAMPIYEELGDRYGIAQIQLGLGVIAMTRREIAKAFRDLLESLLVLQEIGDQSAIAECLERLAQLTHIAGSWQEAAMLFGAVEQMRERVGIPIQPAFVEDHARHISDLRSRLSEEAFVEAFANGRATSLGDAVLLVRGIQEVQANPLSA